MKTFNVIVAGVGGQGLITLLQVIAQAALEAGFDVRTSELHGLSQRGGSVSAHIRFGEKACPVRRRASACLTGVFSPIVARTKADLILALEEQEAIAAADFSSPKTIFLINKYQTPTLAEVMSEKQIENNLSRVGRKAIFLPADALCQKELANNVVSGVFMLGCAVSRGFLPLEKQFVVSALKEAVPAKFLDLNLKALELGFHFGPKNKL